MPPRTNLKFLLWCHVLRQLDWYHSAQSTNIIGGNEADEADELNFALFLSEQHSS